MRVPVYFALLTCIYSNPAFAEVDASVKFGMRESIGDISISPDGSHIAYVQPTAGRASTLYVVDLNAKTDPKIVVTSDSKPWSLRWCGWASNTRLACKLSAIVDDGVLLVPFTRMIAVNIDGSALKALGKQTSSRSLGTNYFDGDVVGWPSADNGEILMSRSYLPENSTGTHIASTAKGLGVDRVDTLTLKSVNEERPRNGAVNYIADNNGNVRILVTEEKQADGTLQGVTHYFYRRPGERNWLPFSRVSEAEPGLQPVAVDDKQNVAYAFGKQGGRQALFKVRLDGSLTGELVLANERVDIDGLITLGRSNRVIGAEFVDEKRVAEIFDPEYKTLGAKLAKALPRLPLVRFLGASRNESRLLLYAGSDSDPGRYYVFDKTARTLDEIALARPQLEGTALSSVKPITYPAADGTNIPAYLTLPPGSTGKGLPGLVLPHGGPSYRDEWGFDWLAQYFASQGFAVLQPNFRGSAGYGDDWYVKNGFKSWRTAVGDVNDAGRWLVSQGIVDKSKLAIFGWSYGGYAALQSGVLDPDLFKAIVAVAPVTDLAMLVQQAQYYVNSTLVAKFVGTGEHVVSGSPRKQAAMLKAPVLMFSGDMDMNVNVQQSKAMDASLRDAGKSSQLVIYPGLDHQLNDSTARADMLKKSIDFLRGTMGMK